VIIRRRRQESIARHVLRGFPIEEEREGIDGLADRELLSGHDSCLRTPGRRDKRRLEGRVDGTDRRRSALEAMEPAQDRFLEGECHVHAREPGELHSLKELRKGVRAETDDVRVDQVITNIDA